MVPAGRLGREPIDAVAMAVRGRWGACTGDIPRELSGKVVELGLPGFIRAANIDLVAVVIGGIHGGNDHEFLDVGTAALKL
jgi:hypothetical protein